MREKRISGGMTTIVLFVFIAFPINAFSGDGPNNGMPGREATSMPLVLQIDQACAGMLESSSALCATGEKPDDDWAAVKALSVGTRLKIYLNDGSLRTGKLTGATDSGLTLRAGASMLQVARDKVKKIQVVTKKASAKYILIGAGAGFAGGALLGHATQGESADDPWMAETICGCIGAGAGAVIGWLAGSTKHVTVYSAIR